MGIAGPTHDERSWTFDLDPGGRRPGPRHRAAPGGLRAARPRLRPGHHRAGHRRHPDRRGGHQRLPADHARPVDRVARATTAPARPTSTPRTCGTRSTRSIELVYRDVNNGVYRCGFAGTQEAYEKAYHRLFARLDWLSERLGGTALPRRRHDHRGRRPAVHDAGPLRRRLPRPLQVQPAQADRDAGAVGLRPGPVPDAGLRRHDRLRPHQAALLLRPHATSTRPASCRPGPTCGAGSRRTAARRSAAGRSATALRPGRLRRRAGAAGAQPRAGLTAAHGGLQRPNRRSCDPTGRDPLCLVRRGGGTPSSTRSTSAASPTATATASATSPASASRLPYLRRPRRRRGVADAVLPLAAWPTTATTSPTTATSSRSSATSPTSTRCSPRPTRSACG